MSLSFLPAEIFEAVSNLNQNFLTEIRLRKGLPVIVEYKGKYRYLTRSGISDDRFPIVAKDISQVLFKAVNGSFYSYSEQMKSGFITVGHGVRIGIAGEYVTQGGVITAVRCVTSMNIRIPHEVKGCADGVYSELFSDGVKSTLLVSKPGYGKTTMLRDLAAKFSEKLHLNILIFDERNEIAAINSDGDGFYIGETVDVVRCADKLGAISSAIRAMKPQLIITDELYGDDDIKAVKYAVDCGICVIASSHVTSKSELEKMPFEYFVKLTGIGQKPEIYDKNFNTYRRGGVDDGDRRICIGG